MWAIITRTLDESRYVETLTEGRFLCNSTSRHLSTCSEEQLGRRKAHQVTAAANHRLLPIIDVKEWVQVVNTWTVESTATDDEGTAAEISLMIKIAKPRDANISRLQLVGKTRL